MDPYTSNGEVITCNSELKPPDNRLLLVAFQAPFIERWLRDPLGHGAQLETY